MPHLLEVSNLCVDFMTPDGPVRAVDHLTFRMDKGEVLGMVGESGSGKSVSALALMGLLDEHALATADYLALDGQPLLDLSPEKRRRIIGQRMSIIFQEPKASLNPCFTLGTQLREAIRVHEKLSRPALRAREEELLAAVGLPDARALLDAYPHQLSGGLCQRLMIAMAVACRPRLLIADEPTTSLDVTIQAQILDLLLRLAREQDMGLVLITHDFALLSESTQRVLVMYCGELVEAGPTAELLRHPRHPYTRALIDSIPHFGPMDRKCSRLQTLRGTIPALDHLPVGCRLGPRCPRAEKTCVQPPRLRREGEILVRCHFPLEDYEALR
ncbi:MAG: ABC transporter ATP-binding protein [Gammaproteobacteria bacterium]|nr:ABC transporter ATP-binding protein [Gammaproteobacteria bacterium]